MPYPDDASGSLTTGSTTLVKLSRLLPLPRPPQGIQRRGPEAYSPTPTATNSNSHQYQVEPDLSRLNVSGLLNTQISLSGCPPYYEGLGDRTILRIFSWGESEGSKRYVSPLQGHSVLKRAHGGQLRQAGHAPGGAYNLNTLAQFLCERYDIYDPLEELLKELDASRIPALPVAGGDALGNPIIKQALRAMHTVVLILLSFPQGTPSAELKIYTTRSFKMVLENWPDIVTWILRLLLHHPTEVVISSANLIRAIAVSAPEQPECAFAEELISQSRTIDAAFLLLSRKDPMTGRYWTLPSQSPLQCCFLADLLQAYTDTPLGLHSMASRLLSATPRTRKVVVRSLITRVQELVDTGTAASAQCVFQAVFRLVAHPILSLDRDFGRQNFLAEFTSALFKLSDRALTGVSADKNEWDHIAECFTLLAKGATLVWGANPFVNVSKLVQGRVFTSARRCMDHTSGDTRLIVARGLQSLLPYLYLEKVYLPAVRLEWDEPQGLSGVTLKVWRQYQRAFEDNHDTYLSRKERTVWMCSNLQVRPLSLSSCPVSHSFTHCSVLIRCTSKTNCDGRSVVAVAPQSIVQKHTKSKIGETYTLENVVLLRGGTCVGMFSGIPGILFSHKHYFRSKSR